MVCGFTVSCCPGPINGLCTCHALCFMTFDLTKYGVPIIQNYIYMYRTTTHYKEYVCKSRSDPFCNLHVPYPEM